MAQKLNLTDNVMIIVGSMIGSGIFIVSADMARQLGSPLLIVIVWALTGLLTLCGALSYGELAGAMPKAGGQYVYLREAFGPLAGFLYGWSYFTVIQTGTLAAVAVAFAKFTGVFVPFFSPENNLLDLGLFSLSSEQLLGLAVLALLTVANFQSVKRSAVLQNVFTFAKTAALLGLIVAGFAIGFGGKGDWGHFSTGLPEDFNLSFVGVFTAAMVGAIFSSVAWENATFTAGETLRPERNVPLSLLIGTGIVTALYVLANVVYGFVLPVEAMQTAPNDRVGTALMQAILGDGGRFVMAALIMVSVFGCLNGLILAGARVFYAMAKDGLFFKKAAHTNKAEAPTYALAAQGIWAGVLVLSGSYSELLNYVVFATLVFYIATVAAVFYLRRTQPNMPRPYRTWGYPWVPGFYILLASIICIGLLSTEKTAFQALAGLGIAALGVPLFYAIRRKKKA